MSNEFNKKCILIVEDDKANAAVLRSILTKSGFENTRSVHTGQGALDFLGIADDGQELFDLNEYKTVSLVILDVMLPDIVGFEICKRIKHRISPSLPVILITGFNITEYVAQGVEAGADDFLSKPFEPDEIVARVTILLKRNLLNGQRHSQNDDEIDGLLQGDQLNIPDDESIGDYVIEDMLSWSASTIVYTVRHKDNGSQYVLKRLLRQVLDFPDVVDRFEREIQIMEGLTHPNICKVFEEGIVDDCPYCVIEYIDGNTLESLVNKRKLVDFQTIYKVAIDVANALQCVHEANIIHRDIKLNNIFLSNDGDVKLGDFGVAMQMGETRITQHGYAVGTPIYMSPEQFDGTEVTFLSDIYSYGATLYNLITGQPPFTAANVGELMVKHLRESPEPLSKHRSEIPNGWDSLIIEGCLAKLPEDRVQSMAEILTILDKIPLKEHSG